MKQVAGIDVGKQILDVSIRNRPVQRYNNHQEDRNEMLSMLKHEAIELVVCEATGGYERELVKVLRAGGIGVHVAHPNKVRAYAQALGQLAKTDRLDAEVLRSYGEHFALVAQDEEGPEKVQLRRLSRRRQQLVRIRSQEHNRLEHLMGTDLEESISRHLAWLDTELKEVEQAYRRVVSETASLAHQMRLYQSVCGIGEVAAVTLMAELPELGKLSGASLTSLVGLAPWSHDSGQQRGHRSIRGGRAGVRKILYMAALAAIRHDGTMKTFYSGLRKRGKAGKVALVAVMRKLLLMLNAVVKRGTPWVKQYSQLACAA